MRSPLSFCFGEGFSLALERARRTSLASPPNTNSSSNNPQATVSTTAVIALNISANVSTFHLALDCSLARSGRDDRRRGRSPKRQDSAGISEDLRCQAVALEELRMGSFLSSLTSLLRDDTVHNKARS
jgi:hypothetical protein